MIVDEKNVSFMCCFLLKVKPHYMSVNEEKTHTHTHYIYIYKLLRWHRLIGVLTRQLLPSYGRQRVGVADSLQLAEEEAGRWTKAPSPSLLPVPALCCQLAAPAATQW